MNEAGIAGVGAVIVMGRNNEQELNLRKPGGKPSNGAYAEGILTNVDQQSDNDVFYLVFRKGKDLLPKV